MRVLLASLTLALLTGCAASASGTGAPSSSESEANASEGVELRDLALDSRTGTLSFHYGIGGGCASHTAKTSVQLTQANEGLVAKVKVVDVSSEPDFCEAFLTIAGTADLKELIAAEAKVQGIDVTNQRVALDLPFARTSVQPREVPAKESAPVKTPVSDVTHVSLDGAGQLAFSYVTGGGCAEHQGVASVELAPDASGSVTVKVSVVDESSAPDFCEALIGVEGQADLHALITEAAKASGLAVEGRSLMIELPRASLDL